MLTQPSFHTPAGSRLVGGRAVHKGGVAGFQSGEGPSAGTAPLRKVKIIDHYGNQELEIEVPEDRCAAGCTLTASAV